MNGNLKSLAERYFRGVYEGDPSIVDEVTSADIISSYPIFEQLFGSPTIRGRKAITAFAERFREKWSNRRVTIYESLQESDKVVLVWGFQAQRNGRKSDDVQRWGGITLFRFDSSGRITEEIGEESAPGPIGRLTAGGRAR